MSISATLSKSALDLRGGDVLVGEAAGTTTVYDTRHNSLVQGFVAVETEHGHFLLDDDRDITFAVIDETITAHVPAERPETVQKAALDLTGGDVLVGDAGGTCLVHDIRPGSLLPGFVTVETEHGTLILDDDPEVTASVRV